VDTTTDFPVLGLEEVVTATIAALRTYVHADLGVATDATYDAGPALLASLAVATGLDDLELAHQVLARWLVGLPGGNSHLGAFEGLAACLVATQAASSFYPRFGPLAMAVSDSIANLSSARCWRTSKVAWEDYDLICGPAGIVLALVAGHASIDQSLPPARHLVQLCDRELTGFRLGDDRGDERRFWNLGRVNTGLAHGVTGVAAALRAMVDASAGAEEFAQPLRRVCAWLMCESYLDGRRVRTWPPAGLDGRRPPQGLSRRQAWCYGTPGVAWTLWDAGRALNDRELQAFALDAMRSFCTAFEERWYLDDGPVDATVGICHGAAGTLAVADAFARHASLPAAAVLRDHLATYLLDRLEDVHKLARENMSLLSGAAGVLAVLLTVSGGARGWLTQIALR
jgi:lantibiotic biosynthesis protein